jgi:hypothetical protein
MARWRVRTPGSSAEVQKVVVEGQRSLRDPVDDRLFVGAGGDDW